MPVDAVERRLFLRNLDFGHVTALPLAANGAEPTDVVFTKAQEQAVVVGSDIVSFTQPVEAEFREAISDSALVAQLAANAKFDAKLDPMGWFDTYFAVLGGLGWVTQVRDTAEYKIKSDGLQVHQAITDVIVAFLGPIPGAAKLIKLALDSLHSMDQSSPLITLFNRESQHATVGRFQFTLVRRSADDANTLLADAMCFAIEAEKTITQILFFKLSKKKARLRRSLGTVSIGQDALQQLRPLLKQKVKDYRTSFLADLPLKAGV
jgi:hypothetical protein